VLGELVVLFRPHEYPVTNRPASEESRNEMPVRTGNAEGRRRSGCGRWPGESGIDERRINPI